MQRRRLPHGAGREHRFGRVAQGRAQLLNITLDLCVERWAAALREHREPQDGTEVPYVGATARLYELELARDDAFGFFERTTHRRVPLLEGYPEEYSDDESVRRKAKKAKKEKKKEF